jgi:hypothetical protein
MRLAAAFFKHKAATFLPQSHQGFFNACCSFKNTKGGRWPLAKMIVCAMGKVLYQGSKLMPEASCQRQKKPDSTS